MAEITRKRVGELQRGVFKVLLDQPEGLAAKDVLQKMEATVPPTAFERDDYPNHPGVRRFEKMIRFATIAPVKAGWLVKDKGRWYLTEEGRNAYSAFSDPEVFRKEASRLYHKWHDTQPDEASQIVSDLAADTQADVEASSTLEEAEESAWSEIEKYLQGVNPFDLQKLVAALLKAMGYHISYNAPPGPDGGIDIIAHTDPLGTSNPRIKVQVKRRADKIGVEGLRSFMAVLGEHDVGIFVSTGGFTSDAEFEARSKETRKITLLDMEKLVSLWVSNYGRIEDSDKALLPLRPVYYLAPND